MESEKDISLPARYNLSKEDLDEILALVEAGWSEKDPKVLKFISDVRKLRKENRVSEAAMVIEEFVIRLAAEYLTRMSKG